MEKKSNHLTVCIICGILTAFGIAVSIVSMINGDRGVALVNDIINLLTAALLWYYALYGYKKPNGNLLKFIIWLFTVPFLTSVYARALKGDAWGAVVRAVTIGLLCYISGRLHRVKQNVILMSIVTVLILATKATKLIQGSATVSTFSSLVLWIDICVAYVLRYKEHREAGLADALKNNT